MVSPETPGAPAPVTPDPSTRTKNYISWLLFGVAALAVAYARPEFARTVVVFCVTLGVLVFVHEWGHYQFARWGGMKVNRFGIGFPPWIYTVRRNDIDYSIGALPIGGMVDIAGLGSEEEMVATAKGETAANPMRSAVAEVPHGQKQFQEATLGWRFMTLFAGPLMNFLYSILVFIAIYTMVGIPLPVFEPRVQSVAANTPAARAGLQGGDRILGVNGQRSGRSDKIREWIRDSNGKPVTLIIERKGQTLEKQVTPVTNIPGTNGTPSIGIIFDQKKLAAMHYERVDTLTAIKSGFLSAAGISLSILDTIKRAVTRDLSKEETEGIRGPIGIAQTIGESAARSWQEVVLMSAMLSVNLGLLNLLPFPALDGGRILFLAYEFVMRRPFDPRKEGVVHMVGMAMLLAFMLFITFRDVVMNIRS
jgi:regulator of sigma E protease